MPQMLMALEVVAALIATNIEVQVQAEQAAPAPAAADPDGAGDPDEAGVSRPRARR